MGHGFYAHRRETAPGESDSPPMEIQDIVKLCTAAKRAGKGDLVWLTWDGGSGKKMWGFPKRRKTHPFHASTMLAISQTGACAMKQLWDRCIGTGHMDVVLLRALMDSEEFRREVPACFCWPSVGHRTHYSTILPEERVAMWTLPWVQEGTRKYSGVHRHRTLHEFCSSGAPPQIREPVMLPDCHGEDLRWFTFSLDRDPNSTADEPVASAKGKGKKKPSGEFEQKDHSQSSSQPDSDSQAARLVRSLRAAQRLYANRFFTGEFEKARFYIV